MTHLSRLCFLICCLLVVSAHAADDNPLLFEAVRNTDKAKIEALLANGADVNAMNMYGGGTLLHTAVRVGKKDIVELLLAKGAEINAKAIDSDGGGAPLHWAAEKDIVELLLANGADVNAKDREGWTPLHFAARDGKKDVAARLLARGADVNAKILKGATPLHMAVVKGHKGMTEWLQAKGADVNAKDKDGETPLHYAVSQGKKDIAELLLAKGANVNAKEYHGYTPFSRAVLQGDQDTAKWLLAKGADINVRDAFGLTPLHQAASYGKKEAAEDAKWLLAHGADINAATANFGNTPLHEAANHGNLDVARVLVAHGADARVRNRYSPARAVVGGRLPMNGGGETPADCADKISDPEKQRVMVAFLENAAIASWQQSAGSNLRQALQNLVDQLKHESSNQTLRKAILDLEPKLRPRPAVPSDAEHFEGRAKYMLEELKDARSETDMLDVAREYLKAMEAAPWIAGYYFDLCLILEIANRPFEAQRACEFYLVAAPEAEDASDVRMKIAGLGVQMERKQYRDEGRDSRTDERLGWLATYNLYR